jgi:hypothetical protein
MAAPIIDSQMDPNNPASSTQGTPTPTPEVQTLTPPASSVPEVEPMTSEVDQATGTVEGRLNSITETGSTYTNLASRDAKRNSNSRGLINSSMSSQAGVDASIRAALPIAQQDATEMNTTRRANQDITNRFRENRQNTNLNMEAATHQSGLTNEENAILNDLTMKRDDALSVLTQAENQQLNDLEMVRNEALHVFDIARDNNSSALNESLASLESDLRNNEMMLETDQKIRMESILQDQRFGDEYKIQMVTSMNSLIRDAQNQMVEVGMSDRTAAQQAAAIALIRENKNNQVAAYQTMLQTTSDFDWGGSSSFSPSYVVASGATPVGDAASTYTAPPPAPVTTSAGSNAQGGEGTGGGNNSNGGGYGGLGNHESSDGGRHGSNGPGNGNDSCFVAGTLVLMADGSYKRIQDIEIGEDLQGMEGEINTVTEFDHPILGERSLWAINNSEPFVTSEHPFMTPDGWKSIDPAKTDEENSGLVEDPLVIGDEIQTDDGERLLITSLRESDHDSGTQLYNFKLSGNNTYYADSFLVHNKGGGGSSGGGGNANGGGSAAGGPDGGR